MSENEAPSNVSFLLHEPTDELKKTYSMPVTYLGQPTMWFKNTSDPIDVKERLDKGEDPESIQKSFTSGNNQIAKEYTGKVRPWQYDAAPMDNFHLLNVPGQIVDMTPQTKNQIGSTTYTNSEGETYVRMVRPEYTTREKTEAMTGYGAYGSYIG